MICWLFFATLMALSGCESGSDKDPISWDQQRYTGAPTEQSEAVKDDFGACSANDLVNFSCD